MKLLGSYEQLCSNPFPEETEENEESELESTTSDPETTGKEFLGEYFFTESYLYKYHIDIR